MNPPTNKKSGNRSVWIIDSTLRDGEQAPGVAFSAADKMHLAAMLADAGIDELEVGTPARGDQECDTIRLLTKRIGGVRITPWCRALTRDIELAASCGVRSIHISFPVSSRLMRAFEKGRDWIRRQLEELVPYACAQFDHVSIGAQDATRAEDSFLSEFVRSAFDLGAHRLRIADTVGIATPHSITSLFRSLVLLAGDSMLEFHGHNDLGMATANTISAVEAGAGAVSVTVNGLGERAGNGRLEEIVTALLVATEFRSRINPRRLPAICSMVAELSGRSIPVDKPITGSTVFTHESRIHCHALKKDPMAYQPFLPAFIGRETGHFVIGSMKSN